MADCPIKQHVAKNSPASRTLQCCVAASGWTRLKHWESVNTSTPECQREGTRTETSHLTETAIPVSFGFISFS